MTSPFEAIPEDLKAVPRWLLWKRVQKPNGDVAKMPMRPDGAYPASAHNPSTWLTFDEAVRRIMHWPKGWCGIGFSLRADDDIGVVDLDGCHDPETGDVAMWAREVIDAFEGAYVELSPSRKGFHKRMGRSTIVASMAACQHLDAEREQRSNLRRRARKELVGRAA